MTPRPRALALVVLAALLATVSGAQWDDFADFDDWKKQRLEEYDRFVSEQDRAFATFLKQSWRLYDSAPSEVPAEPPKPEDAPVREEEPASPPQDPTPPAPLPPAPAPEREPRRPPGPVVPPAPSSVEIEAGLLGLRFPLVLDRRLGDLPRFRPREEAIADAWLQLGGVPSEPVVEQFRRHREQYDLGDWGTVSLIVAAASEVYPGDPDRATLLQWFWLVKSGWDARLSFNPSGVFLLLPSEHDLYGVSYLAVAGRKYYVFRGGRAVRKADPLRTYRQDYPGADRALDLVLVRLPRSRPETVVKTLGFDYDGQHHEFDVTLDRQLLNYLDTYPQSELAVHFAAGVSGAARRDLVAGLRPLLEGRTQLEAVRIVLRFVQNAFAYATDQEQFGRENYLFPDQTLYYPACDCEDRSILFRLLVRELVGLEAVGLDYPGHAACGVSFTGDVRGDRFDWNGRTWVICDPTYINADPGMTMPLVRGQVPRVVLPAM